MAQFVGQLLQGVERQVLEVVDVLQLRLLPAFEAILVKLQLLYHLGLHLWENLKQFLEGILGYLANCTVIFCLDCGGAPRASDKGNLAEVHAWVECAHKTFLPVLVFDEALALALRNDIEVEGLFALLNLDFFWLRHHQLNLLNHEFLEVIVQAEDRVRLQHACKDKSSDLLLEGRRDQVEELAEFVLVVEGLLNVLQVTNNFGLDFLRQFHILHSSVCRVNLRLEFS